MKSRNHRRDCQEKEKTSRREKTRIPFQLQDGLNGHHDPREGRGRGRGRTAGSEKRRTMPTEEGKELAKLTIDGHKKKGDHKDNGNAP